MSSSIRILEVGPRDGLQNERITIPTDAKIRFINNLAQAGLEEIEVTSFVSPKWVPQLSDAAYLVPSLPKGPKYSVLVPNLKGLERAIEVNVSRIAIFTAASEAFTQKNINMTIAQSLDVFEQIVLAFRKEQPDGWVRGYVSTAFECPYSGKVDHESVHNVVDRLLAMGVDEISIGDTTGVASPTEVRHLTRHLLQTIPITKLAYHFHDTHGTAIANTMSALDLGIRAFDSSAAGLGGCPYAPGAAGNLATEDLVYLLEREGLSTGINLDSLSKASIEVLAILGRHPVSKSQIAQFSASETSPK